MVICWGALTVVISSRGMGFCAGSNMARRRAGNMLLFIRSNMGSGMGDLALGFGEVIKNNFVNIGVM